SGHRTISIYALCLILFFFFKQKTAYEIGLGIPAEPLSDLFLIVQLHLRIKKSLLKCNWTIRKRLPRCKMRLKKRLLAFSRRLHARIRKTRYMHRSEERRVGKECRAKRGTKRETEEDVLTHSVIASPMVAYRGPAVLKMPAEAGINVN